MRVALLTQNARSGDAIGRHVVEKAAYFLDRGTDVRVVVGDARELHPALRPLTVTASIAPRGLAWLSLASADLISVEFPQYYPQLDWLPLLADGRRRIVFDYHGVSPLHGCMANHRHANWRSADARAFAGFADVVQTHSEFAELELRAAAAIDRSRHHRLGYVIDENRFRAARPSKSLHDRLELSPDCKLLLFVGRLATNKRVPVLVKALCRLPDCHAVIVGPGNDIYESERLLCREVAQDQGVAQRVHFLGTINEDELLDCYRSATALVMPSIHEGFCFPVIEAMACGLPVIAARAAALPETVGDAGLTFIADDPDDLARAVRRMVTASETDTRPLSQQRRIAVVTPSYGNGAGGAQRSLSQLARLLHQRGSTVEVLTTQIDGPKPSLPVRCFEVNRVDPIRRNEAQLQLGHDDTLNEAKYFANTLGSEQLVRHLKTSAYDVVIVGPVGNRLARDVIRAVGDRGIVVPCIHDEPNTRTRTILDLMDRVGGVLYHSAEEQHLSQSTFGFNHPNAAIVGTVVDLEQPGNPSRGSALAGGVRYIFCCGRKVREKGLPQTITWARQYAARHPERFRFVFAGDGDYPIPAESWALDLGYVSETDKRDLMRGADGLLQLSDQESLSLVVLEALAQATPVIVNGRNAAMVRHINEGSSGWTASCFNEFSQALDELWSHPESAKERGRLGQHYVADQFGHDDAMAQAANEVIENLLLPKSELARRRGLERARQFSRSYWRNDMDRMLETVFDRVSVFAPPRVEITTAEPTLSDAMTWQIQLTHRGGVPLVSTGPGRAEIVARVRAADGEIVHDAWSTPLHEMLHTSRTQLINIAIPTLKPGEYELEAGLSYRHAEGGVSMQWHGILATLTVSAVPAPQRPSLRGNRMVQQLIDAARLLQRLPTEYVDVSTGRLARWKKLIKAKLLNHFRIAYVDEIAQQQSRFNRHVLDMLAELTAAPPIPDRQPVAELNYQDPAMDEPANHLEAANTGDVQ